MTVPTGIRDTSRGQNIPVDTLSSVDAETSPEALALLNEQTLAAHQANDPALLKNCAHLKQHIEMDDLLLPDGANLVCDTSTGTPRPFVLTTLCKQLFNELYQLAHPGVRASQRLVS
ncbi:hypothetical protein MRX96_003008 [Rhipicephalus microplus]